MRVLSVNISKVRHIHPALEPTGLDKQPVTGPVAVTELGLTGDEQGHPQHHGGAEQAVYLYGQADYDWWAQKLDRPLPAGIFGENLTLSEVGSADLCIGDRLVFDHLLLEVTSPRIGCQTFEVWMGIEGFKVWFDSELRPGAYCRVLQACHVQAGESCRLEAYAGERVDVGEVVRLIKQADVTKDDLQRALNTPMNPKHKARIQARLDELS